MTISSPSIARSTKARIDDVGQTGGCQQSPGGSPERLVEGAHFDAGERLRQSGLTRPTPPHLPNDPSVGERRLIVDLVEQTRRGVADGTIPTFGDKDALVQHLTRTALHKSA